MNHTHPILLHTPRLILRLPTEGDSAELKAFEKRNENHLSPWRSASSVDYTSQIMEWLKEYEEGRAIRFLLFLKDHPNGEIIGMCNFSQIFRGPFQACYLGYHIDAAHEGNGLMSEAVKHAIQYMFEEKKLHRIMANYMPSNKKSAELLRKLGFTIEGKAKDYLMINGKWEDHILTSLTNAKWDLKKSIPLE